MPMFESLYEVERGGRVQKVEDEELEGAQRKFTTGVYKNMTNHDVLFNHAGQ